jgi:hypothetical protein
MAQIVREGAAGNKPGIKKTALPACFGADLPEKLDYVQGRPACFAV